MKTNMWMTGAVILGGLAALGCGSSAPIDKPEVLDLLTKPSTGLIGGFAIGDSWTKLKAGHDPRYTVRDDDSRHQLFQDHHSSPMYGVNAVFVVEEDRVVQFQIDVQGREGNDDDAKVIRQLEDDLKAYFDRKATPQGCSRVGADDSNAGNAANVQSSDCTWLSKQDSSKVIVTWRRLVEFRSEALEIQVDPAKGSK